VAGYDWEDLTLRVICELVTSFRINFIDFRIFSFTFNFLFLGFLRFFYKNIFFFFIFFGSAAGP
jgi:hypothetical protein